jgi:hypothetical protein
LAVWPPVELVKVKTVPPAVGVGVPVGVGVRLGVTLGVCVGVTVGVIVGVGWAWPPLQPPNSEVLPAELVAVASTHRSGLPEGSGNDTVNGASPLLFVVTFVVPIRLPPPVGGGTMSQAPPPLKNCRRKVELGVLFSEPLIVIMAGLPDLVTPLRTG